MFPYGASALVSVLMIPLLLLWLLLLTAIGLLRQTAVVKLLLLFSLLVIILVVVLRASLGLIFCVSLVANINAFSFDASFFD